MPTIKLQSSDEEIFDIDTEIVKCSGTIRPMLEELNGEENAIWPLLNVNSSILRKVLNWANYHKDDPTDPTEVEDDESKGKRTDDITSWDADFLKVDQSTLFELIMAANYLDIRDLLDLLCKAVANMIEGKTREEMRKILIIENDFTPEEEAQVRKENGWREEE